MLRNLGITLLLATPVAVALVLALKAIDAPYGVALVGVACFAALFGYVGSVLEERRRGGPSSSRGASSRAGRGSTQAHA